MGTVSPWCVIGTRTQLKHVLAVVALMLGLIAARPALAQGVELFTPLNPTLAGDTTPAQNARIARLRAEPTAKSVTLIRLNPAALAAPQARVSIAGTRSLSLTRESLGPNAATNNYALKGGVPGVPGQATLIVNNSDVTGTVNDGKDVYRIEPVGGGVHAVVKLDTSRFPPEEPPGFVERQATAAPATPPQGYRPMALAPAADSPNADALTTIDIIVGYTPSAQAQVTNIVTTIQLAVAEANQSYVNSNINLRLNLLNTFSYPLVEGSSTFDAMLANFAGNADVNNRRNSAGADVAVLIINKNDFCGLADAIMANAGNAFAVVHYDCATGYYSFAHEIGHLQGARHDPANDPTTTPFSYGHGFQHNTAPTWRTIMAYNCASGCTRLQYWSSPLINYNGVAMGTAASNDNARVLRGTASTVAAFRSPPATFGAGSIWRYTGVACSGNSCPGWQPIDNNPAGIRIAASGSALYQMHNTGRIWRYTGTPCSSSGCPGWQMLDNNGASIGIVADGSALFQLHRTGRIWRYTGVPCSGNSCPGWRMLDNNPATVDIEAAGGQLYQLHNTGLIWRHTGVACSGNSCPGWQRLDNNGATVAIAAGGGALYQLHNSGRIWRYTGTPCSGNSCPGWRMLDNNPASIGIAADGAALYQLHNTGRIWRHTGMACTGNSCPGWQMLDNNPATIRIVASGGQLYQVHNSGRIWRHTGVACSGNSCPGWQMLDNNSASGLIVAGGPLFQMHTARVVTTRTRICAECRPH